MEYAPNTYRQTETDSRLQYMRTAPVSPGTSDQLMAVEKWLWEAPCLPAAALVGGEFTGIKPAIMDKLGHVQQCCEAVVHLRFVAEHELEIADQLATIEHTADVYAQELQRLLGSLFHIDDPFWEQFYARQNSLFDFKNPAPAKLQEEPETTISPLYLQLHYGLFFITLDAIHRCTMGQHKIAYQLLLQSLKWVLTGYYSPRLTVGFRNQEAFHNAIQLVDSLKLPEYKAWLAGHLENIASSPFLGQPPKSG